MNHRLDCLWTRQVDPWTCAGGTACDCNEARNCFPRAARASWWMFCKHFTGMAFAKLCSYKGSSDPVSLVQWTDGLANPEHRSPQDSYPSQNLYEQNGEAHRVLSRIQDHLRLDPAFFRAKLQRWRRGWFRSRRCGNLEPYWDDSNMTMALHDVPRAS